MGILYNIELSHGYFKKYKIKSVFDLTCGTGAQAIYFLKKGYLVKASDYSKGMIECFI